MLMFATNITSHNELTNVLECRGKPINPSQMHGDTATLVDVNNEKDLGRLTWAVYNGVLLLGDPPIVEGKHE